MSSKPLVTNTSDTEQLREARKKVKLNRENELDDIKAVLSSPEAKRFFWRILEHCKVFGSVFEQSSRIYYNSGMQDVGHFIMAEIADADPELIFQMQQQNKKGD